MIWRAPLARSLWRQAMPAITRNTPSGLSPSRTRSVPGATRRVSALMRASVARSASDSGANPSSLRIRGLSGASTWAVVSGHLLEGRGGEVVHADHHVGGQGRLVEPGGTLEHTVDLPCEQPRVDEERHGETAQDMSQLRAGTVPQGHVDDGQGRLLMHEQAQRLGVRVRRPEHAVTGPLRAPLRLTPMMGSASANRTTGCWTIVLMEGSGRSSRAHLQSPHGSLIQVLNIFKRPER